MTRKKKIIITLSIIGGVPLTLGMLYGGLRLGVWIYNISTGYYSNEYPKIQDGHYELDEMSSSFLVRSGNEEVKSKLLEAPSLDASSSLEDESSQSAFHYQCVNDNATNFNDATVYFRFSDIVLEDYKVSNLKITFSERRPGTSAHFHRAEYSLDLNGYSRRPNGDIHYFINAKGNSEIAFDIGISFGDGDYLFLRLDYLRS